MSLRFGAIGFGRARPCNYVLDPEIPTTESGDDDYFTWHSEFSAYACSSSSDATLTWSGSLGAEGWVYTSEFTGATAWSGGKTVATSASLYTDGIVGEWTPGEEEEPPTHIKITVNVGLVGHVYGRAGAGEEICHPPGEDNGDIIWAIAGAGGSASASIDTSSGGSPPGGGVSTQGGITNGLPGGGIGGGANSSGAASINSNSTDTQNIDDCEGGRAGWSWYQDINFSIAYSDYYIVPNNDNAVSVSPALSVFATADVNLETTETDWERVEAGADGQAYVGGTISYTAEDYNY